MRALRWPTPRLRTRSPRPDGRAQAFPAPPTPRVRLTADARNATWRRSPLLLWRTGSFVSATRDLVRIALPLKIFVPGFLWLTLAAVVVCVVLVGVGVISLFVLAFS